MCSSDLRKVGLLGTKYTVTQDFYKQRLIDRGIDVVIPDEAGIDLVNSVIFHELCEGEIKDASREQFRRMIGRLRDEGAEGVILGCTEIGLLIHQEDSPLPVFDTTLIHAARAAGMALDS